MIEGEAVLEFLILIDDLYAMFVLLCRGLLAHICEMAVDRHDGRRGGVPGTVGRTALPALSNGRSYSSHDEEKIV